MSAWCICDIEARGKTKQLVSDELLALVPRPQCTSVAINPSEVLHQSGVTMVDGTLGPLTATEARAFNDVVGEFGASDGGI